MTTCDCHACTAKRRAHMSPAEFAKDAMSSRMVLCPVCGNKRCPKASNHALACTGSNEPNQPGSIYVFTGVRKMTPTERESLHPPEVVDAWHWLDTYCRHYATLNEDQQTTENLSASDRAIAEQHLQTMRDAGLIEHERGFRGNFVKKPL